MRLPRDIISGSYIKPRVFLCHPDKEKICQLDVNELKGTFKFNSYSEITFEVARTYNDLLTGEVKVNPFYDKIEALRLIYIEDFGYFEIQGPELVSDGIKEAKLCTAYSLEYTLSQKYLEDFYVNTGEIGSVEVTYATDKYGEDKANDHIVPVTLYNHVNTKLSLLHLILEKDYAGWKVGHIDDSLKQLRRSFEIDRESIYDFLMNEVCDKFNCYIDFNTEEMTINLYAESPKTTIKYLGGGAKEFKTNEVYSEIKTVSINGYKTTKWEYFVQDGKGFIRLEEAPAVNSVIEIIGVDSTWDSDVFITFDNLSQEIEINYDADEIKTVLTVTFGDNENIREVNLGLPYITDLSYYHHPEWMGQDLYDAYSNYLDKCNDAQLQYAENSKNMQEVSGRIMFEDHRLSLQYSQASVSPETVGTYYVRGGSPENYYYTEISLPAEYDINTTYYSMSGTDLNETKVDNLFEVLKKYFTNDSAWSTDMNALSSDFGFMAHYGYSIEDLHDDLKNASSQTDQEIAVSNFLSIMWQQIGRMPLWDNYYNKYKIVQTQYIDSGLSQKTHEQHGWYRALILLLNSISDANSERQSRILDYEDEYAIYESANIAITNELLMEKNFTKAQLKRLNAFLREDELQLDDIVITDEDTLLDTFKVQQDALETARIELQRISQPQMQFTMSMANIYALSEFEPIIDQFKLGNIIKVGIRPGYIKQSRLLQVDINFEDFSDFSCEFGELTSFKTQSDIHADLLSKAVQAGKSVASQASYWTKGANQANSIDLRLEEGLLNSIEAIKSIDGSQHAYIDKYGIHLEAVNPNTGEIDDKRVWLVNNQIVFTDDGFKTTKTVLGEFTVDGETYYGLLAQAVIAGLVEGSVIKGGTIQIGEYQDEFGNTKYRFEVDELGNVTMNAASISGYVTQGDMNSALEQEHDKIKLEVSNSLAGKIQYYGTCYSAGDARMKTVATDAFTPQEGVMVTVKFISGNKADNPVLYAGDGPMGGEAPIYAYNNALTSDSQYNWTDNSVVTFVYGFYGTESDPSGRYPVWYIADNSSEQIYSRITMTANEIRSEVGATYVTNDTLGNYSTTEQMNSAISQKADSITSTVSKTYATIGQVAHYGTCSTASNVVEKTVVCDGFELYKGASISVKFSHTNSAKGAQLNVNNTGAKNIAADDWNIMSANSSYNWDDNSTVIFTYDGSYWRISDSGALKRTNKLSSEIKQTADKISLIVKENDAGTEFEVNSEAVRMAWNNSNQFIEFAGGEINMYQSESTHNTSTLFAKYNNNGAWYYYSGAVTGKIGTNTIEGSGGLRGLTFNLENTGGYMSWSDQEIADGGYIVKLVYLRKDNTNIGYYKGFNFSSNVHFLDPVYHTASVYYDSNVYIGDNLYFALYSDGDTGLSSKNGKSFWLDGNGGDLYLNGENAYIRGKDNKAKVRVMNNSVELICTDSDGGLRGLTCALDKFIFGTTTSKMVDMYNDIYMNGRTIKDQSDARLKTNIHDSSVDAISLINQIEIKEFDWIETKEHECAGMIAQQLQEIIPDLVSERDSGQLTIKTTKFIPYLIKAIQELTQYVTGEVSTFGMNRRWEDPYTLEEKITFVNNNSNIMYMPADANEITDKPIEALHSERTRPVIMLKGENNNE
jgi:hypothetical protein